jgi:PHD/YefM family antitoxin component YafN of YafNO toxin-antitoxin module
VLREAWSYPCLAFMLEVMTQTMPVSEAASRLHELVEAAALRCEDTRVTDDQGHSALLVSAEEWESVRETMAALSDPGLKPEELRAVLARHHKSIQVRVLAAEVAVKHAELLDRLAR